MSHDLCLFLWFCINIDFLCTLVIKVPTSIRISKVRCFLHVVCVPMRFCDSLLLIYYQCLEFLVIFHGFYWIFTDFHGFWLFSTVLSMFWAVHYLTITSVWGFLWKWPDLCLKSSILEKLSLILPVLTIFDHLCEFLFSFCQASYLIIISLWNFAECVLKLNFFMFFDEILMIFDDFCCFFDDFSCVRFAFSEINSGFNSNENFSLEKCDFSDFWWWKCVIFVIFVIYGILHCVKSI